jgi:hypothetical protein
MITASLYNYESYSFALEQPELDRWLQAGPHAGAMAPDFVLDDLDGEPVRLSVFRGAPVVLDFGSYSCPIFSDRVPAMERLAGEHREARFLVAYAAGARERRSIGWRQRSGRRRAPLPICSEPGLVLARRFPRGRPSPRTH